MRVNLIIFSTSNNKKLQPFAQLIFIEQTSRQTSLTSIKANLTYTLQISIFEGQQFQQSIIKPLCDLIEPYLLQIKRFTLYLSEVPYNFNQMENSKPKIYTAILFIPTLGLFLQNNQIIDHAHFLLILLLIVSSFACYHLTFKSEALNVLRKCLGCLSTALLITYLSAEVGDILSSVYKVAFNDEITFFIKIALMISNMEGNLDLCTDKSETKVSHQSQPASVI